MKTLKVVDIKPIKHNSKRYDIETQHNHNFFANNILVHNSNFAIFMDRTGNIVPASRGNFLSMSDRFFNFQRIFDKYNFEEFLKNVLHNIGNTYQEYNCYISLHGELCGGYYKDMPVIPGVQKIQKEIQYSNDTEFIAFDIRIYSEDDLYMYLPYPDVVSFCNQYNIHCVPILFSGNLIDCLNWSSEHNADDSEIWKIFGMPAAIEKNIREGHVIKPNKNLFMGDTRIIFKDKNDKFKENSGAKIPKEQVVKPELSTNALNFLNMGTQMICKPRFDNVTSKYGEFTIKDFANLMRLMVEDIVSEISKDDCSQSISNVEWKKLRDSFLKSVSSWMGNNKKDLF